MITVVTRKTKIKEDTDAYLIPGGTVFYGYLSINTKEHLLLKVSDSFTDDSGMILDFNNGLRFGPSWSFDGPGQLFVEDYAPVDIEVIVKGKSE